MENMDFIELTDSEILSVSGELNGDEFSTGVGIAGGTVLTVACARVEVPIAAVADGTASGWFCGEVMYN